MKTWVLGLSLMISQEHHVLVLMRGCWINIGQMSHSDGEKQSTGEVQSWNVPLPFYSVVRRQFSYAWPVIQRPMTVNTFLTVCLLLIVSDIVLGDTFQMKNISIICEYDLENQPQIASIKPVEVTCVSDIFHHRTANGINLSWHSLGAFTSEYAANVRALCLFEPL